MSPVPHRLSGAFSFSAPEITPQRPALTVREQRNIAVAGAKHVLRMTRGETHPVMQQVRRTAVKVLRAAYRALRACRARALAELLASLLCAAFTRALASANWQALRFSQLGLEPEISTLV